MSISKIDSALASMRMLESQAKGTNNTTQPINNSLASFGETLNNFIGEVNSVQLKSADLQERNAKGDDNVSLAQTLVAMQEASVQLTFVTEVRNKIIDAYNDVLRMGI